LIATRDSSVEPTEMTGVDVDAADHRDRSVDVVGDDIATVLVEVPPDAAAPAASAAVAPSPGAAADVSRTGASSPRGGRRPGKTEPLDVDEDLGELREIDEDTAVQ
jgi:hypothetical protein